MGVCGLGVLYPDWIDGFFCSFYALESLFLFLSLFLFFSLARPISCNSSIDNGVVEHNMAWRSFNINHCLDRDAYSSPPLSPAQ